VKRIIDILEQPEGGVHQSRSTSRPSNCWSASLLRSFCRPSDREAVQIGQGRQGRAAAFLRPADCIRWASPDRWRCL